jgi:cyclic-di-AMP phosphodiesterase PgpH
MSFASNKRSRSERVSRSVAPRDRRARWMVWIRDREILQRVFLALLATLLMWGVSGAWAPRFPYRTGYVPPRDIVAHTKFSRPDPRETEARQRQVRGETLMVYQHDVQPLIELRKALKNQVFQIVRSDSYEAVSQPVWHDFLQPRNESSPSVPNAEEAFEELRAALQDDMELSRFESAVQQAMQDYERDGLLENLVHSLEEGSQSAVWVHPVGNESYLRRLDVNDVRIAEATTDLEPRLATGFESAGFTPPQSSLLVRLTSNWLGNKRFPSTLSINQAKSQLAREEAMNAVEPAMITYNVGDKLASGGEPLRNEDVQLLLLEYQTRLAQLTRAEVLSHTLANLGMYLALYILCGTYIHFHERRLLLDMRRFVTMLGLVLLTVVLCLVAARDAWRAEIIPLSIFAITVSIAYHRELALICSAAVALIIVMSLGHGLPEFILLTAAAAGPILLMTRIRSRTKLIYLGLAAGGITMATAMGVGTLTGQSFGSPHSSLPWLAQFSVDSSAAFVLRLLSGSAWFGFCSVLGGLLMHGLLPFIEKLFDVQTDLSLLELGDASHPLLRELARRAPGTYNHSINVASLGEVAAEAIGANGLLVRVGAYFHDIGKMVKPGYFVENQGQSPSRHDSLMPAMSTLVIIAHVKDGAELARRHHLPQSLIDFIEQHHGTTLVEYFYDQAAKLSANDPDRGEVDETSFRYPGPKPQRKEAAVMMMADAVESASRTLVDPTPARIENLVHELARKRLLDGQFDECNLTLREMSLIEDSLAKSLTAVYHSRIKYPDHITA